MFGFKRKEKETVNQYKRSLTQKNPSLTDWLGSNLGEVPVSFKNREVLLDNVLITQVVQSKVRVVRFSLLDEKH